MPVSICPAALYLHLRVTGNRDIAAGTVSSAADTGTADVALGRYLAALDGNVAAAAFVAAADTGTSSATSGGYLAVGDGNVTAAASSSAADTGTVEAALGRYLAAGYGNVTAAAAGSAADTGTSIATSGGYLAALDGNVTAAAFVAAADTGTQCAAGGREAAILIFVRNGQGAVVLLFHTGVGIATLNRIGSVQLDVYVSFARGRDGCPACCPGVNVDILQGHVGGGVFLRCDGDGVVCRPAAAGDDGITVYCWAASRLGNGLALYRSTDGNAALIQIPVSRQDVAGDKGPQQHQGQQSGHDLFHSRFLLRPRKGIGSYTSIEKMVPDCKGFFKLWKSLQIRNLSFVQFVGGVEASFYMVFKWPLPICSSPAGRGRTRKIRSSPSRSGDRPSRSSGTGG